ncbi:PLP-dependent aminotransferase family protein [Kribbella qitaiheensis]|uniref:PLP-dependent aminotransferase family protein n=1 Tax=Kribbella qitaiheensis TaxID=1544730 RepID=A0A7G6WZ57_9ACTN|nr:PLP-dependent aminotransferase family protein [Kribbella qitaiheensis]QNE19272.1 PLP-dependent aminotransferase family protein [Kribbella qitaiheensis]
MNERSTSEQLVEVLRDLIRQLSAGDRLPSSRELIDRHGVGPGTVSRAIAQLSAEGLVITRPGSGTYVALRPQRAGVAPDTAWQTVALADRSIDLSSVSESVGPVSEGAIRLDGGYLHPSLQPTRELTAALARAARRPDAWDRAPANGLSALRTAFARMAGDGATPDDVLITAGGQSALSIAFRAIAGPASPVLMESPTYPGALTAARAAGLRPVPVPIDQGGLRPDLLAEAFARSGARLLYCQPTYQNPTGAVLAAERRRQVVEVARAAGAFVLEDDFARLLGHRSSAPKPLLAEDRDGTVVYLTSLTKPAAPSLRIGALIARGPVLERLRAMRQVDDFFVPRPLQEAALELVSSPSWERHLRGLGISLADRCRELALQLGKTRPDWSISGLPDGGLHLWVRLPAGLEDTAVTAEARRRGVVVSAGQRYFATERSGSWLRFNFAAAADLAELSEAARRLAQI